MEKSMATVYLDYTSASPVDPRVLMFAVKYASEEYGNPSSMHSMGVRAKQALEHARRRVESLVNAESPATILFTASATESNNLAIHGTVLGNKTMGKTVVSSAIEHVSVIKPMEELAKNGYHYATAPVDKYGVIDLDKLGQVVTKDTVVTSINYGNGEIGTIEPIREISKIVHERGSFLHVDATAAAGKVPIDVQKDDIDLLTISSNDFYGPRGAAATSEGQRSFWRQ
jgi:cysteine desulfurase